MNNKYAEILAKIKVTYNTKIVQLESPDPEIFRIEVRQSPILDLTELTEQDREILLTAIHKSEKFW